MPASVISPELLGSMLQQFLAEAPDAAIIEDGVVLADFGSAKYSVTGDGKCVLHIWSEERNMVRRVLDAQGRNGSLQLQVLRFGQSQPTLLEIAAYRDRRSGTASGLRGRDTSRCLSVFCGASTRDSKLITSAAARIWSTRSALCTLAACCARARRPLPYLVSMPTKRNRR
jgi:hypothetical protein